MTEGTHNNNPQSCSGSCCLKLEDVSVQFSGEEILNRVSFHLHCGEIAALIGPNGAGKSSLFRSILQQIPYTGTINFTPSERAVLRMSDSGVEGARGIRPRIGYVPQSPSFERGDPLSVLDFFIASTTRWPVWLPIPNSLREQANICFSRVHSEDLLDRAMGALSGGQLQRVLIAMALEPLPQVLILDEPLSGVDIEGKRHLMDMLDEIRKTYDLSILLSTHDFATLDQFADQVLLLNCEILKCGTPDEVLSSPEFYNTFHLRMRKGGV